MTADASYNTKNYSKQNGDDWVVGGTLEMVPGGAFKGAGGADMLEAYLTLDITDASVDATYYMIAPCAGNIRAIYGVVDGAIGTADLVITPSIGASLITGGAVTIPTAASAAGSTSSAQPSAANAVVQGSVISFAVSGAGAGGTPKLHLLVVIAR